jgi:sulfate-transporting ATPase
MEEVLRFAVLGLGTGSLYALAAQGLVVTYRASGVINFAQGAFGMAGAMIFYDLRGQDLLADSIGFTLPWQLALVVGVLVGAALGLVSYLLVMRPLRNASPMVRMIASLGIMSLLQYGFESKYTVDLKLVQSIIPNDFTTLWGSVSVGQDRLILFGVAVVSTLALMFVYSATRFGLTTSAVAENAQVAAALGRSPDLIASVNWALGGAIAAAVAILLAPIAGLGVTQLTLLVLPALAAALVGRFSSLGLTLVAGLLIGVIQSELARYSSVVGLAESVPFVVIVLVLLVRGNALPERGESSFRLPVVGDGVISVPRVLAALAAVVVLVSFVFDVTWIDPYTTSILFAFVALSLVVVTGYCGQLSIAQFALAGIGAFIAGRLIDTQGLSFEVALLVGVLGVIPIGLIVAVPALRTRGVTLAIATLGLALTIEAMVLSVSSRTGGLEGTTIGPLELFGIPFDSVNHPERFAYLVTGFFAVCAIGVANVRRGRAGRRMIAVRSNERAAASIGISVYTAKLYAFALAAAIAGLGGVLIAYRFPTVNYADGFQLLNSVNAVLVTVTGGIGYILGAILGALGMAPHGLGARPFENISDLDQILRALSGAIVIIVLIVNQNGIAQTHNLKALRKLFRRDDRRAPVPPLPDVSRVRVRVVAKALAVHGLTVRFGGVVAVDGVDLTVEPGQIHGLIGPNGAGKTTFIDAVTGFVTIGGGEMSLGGKRIEQWPAARRTRAGLARSFQSLELFHDMSIRDNLRTASDSKALLPYLADLVYPRDVPLSSAAIAAVHDFGLEPYLDLKPDDLSYGRRRLVGIARALATQPSVLLLDEPASGLDNFESGELGKLIVRLAHEWGIGILLVEHDVPLVLSVCDHVTVMQFGRVLAAGTPDEINADQAVLEAYLGEEEVEELTGIEAAHRSEAEAAAVGDGR